MQGRIHIGTSGWHYGHWRNVFYPPGMPSDMYLATYAKEFCTVEINNTFYQLPTDKSVRAWVSATPPGFLFALKASGYITHRKRLKDPEQSLPRFLALLPIFSDKLGPILFQLPPRFSLDLERLQEFFVALPAGRSYAFEFRDKSWMVEPVRRLLTEHDAAFCLYDRSGLATPEWITAPFVYVRMHGASPLHMGRYTDAMLEEYAKRMRLWAADGRDVYCYFNNDPLGNAIFNARSLIRMVDGTC